VSQPQDVSSLLVAWNRGDRQALDQLMSVFYPELRRIARYHLGRRSPDHSLESAALANETYLRLIAARGIQCESRAHFVALCALMIRRLVVDHSRRRRYAKRGGDAIQITIDQSETPGDRPGVDVLALDQALSELAKIDPRKSQVVEMRYFGGLSVEESAEVLRVSPETVKRDWKFAKSWLFRELRRR
jgi:RNA polymerase sigma factor (TIGR02999 family)